MPELPPPAGDLLERYSPGQPSWPQALGSPIRDALGDRFRGSLLWGATGDALGRPTEARSWHRIRERWGAILVEPPASRTESAMSAFLDEFVEMTVVMTMREVDIALNDVARIFQQVRYIARNRTGLA